MKNRTYRRFKNTVSTVRKSHSRMLAACRRRNSAQLDSSRRGAGPIPSRLRISQPVLPASETPSPTSSPSIRRYPQPGFSPARRTTSSRTTLRRRRTTGTTMRIPPAARHQLAMPPQQHRRPHQKRRPRPPRQRRTERRQQSPISRPKPRAPDLPPQHPQLMAQHQDLDLLLTLRAQPQHKQLQQPPQHPIEKRQHHAPRMTHLDRRPYRPSPG